MTRSGLRPNGESRGVETTDPDRFAVRSKYVAGVGRMPWLMWRSKEITALSRELNAAVHAAAPRRRSPWSLPAWMAARPAARPGESIARPFRPASRGRSVRPGSADLAERARLAAGLARHRGSPTEALARSGHQLRSRRAGRRPAASGIATIRRRRRARRRTSIFAGWRDAEESLPKKAGVEAAAAADGNGPARLAVEGVSRAAALRGAAPRVWLTALPLGDGPAADEPLGHALAALDARWVFLAEKAASGQEDRLRRFARVFCVLPKNDGPAVALAGPQHETIRRRRATA